jgi:acetylornithine aminotransferase
LIQELALIPGIREVRGAGLLIGIELEIANANEVVRKLAEAGVLVNAASASTIRIAPALIVSDFQIRKFINTFREVLTNGS